MRKSEWITGVVYLSLLGTLPFVGHWIRTGESQSCTFDGGEIDHWYRVQIIEGDGGAHPFCCIRCAENWLKTRSRKPDEQRRIIVVDEIIGTEIDARHAYFVRSRSVTNRVTGNRVHTFKDRHEAERYANSLGGRLLAGNERPFSRDASFEVPGN